MSRGRRCSRVAGRAESLPPGVPHRWRLRVVQIVTEAEKDSGKVRKKELREDEKRRQRCYVGVRIMIGHKYG